MGWSGASVSGLAPDGAAVFLRTLLWTGGVPGAHPMHEIQGQATADARCRWHRGDEPVVERKRYHRKWLRKGPAS